MKSLFNSTPQGTSFAGSILLVRTRLGQYYIGYVINRVLNKNSSKPFLHLLFLKTMEIDQNTFKLRI